ncbi:MAG: glycosyltransferase family 2 protein [Pseudomonadota bacterium]
MLEALRVGALYARLALRDRRAGARLRCVQDRTAAIGAEDILLVACLRNEAFRMQAFAEHYRSIGVGRFLIVDNGGEDGLMDWASDQPDVSVWRTGDSYKDNAFGMLWCNALLHRHGRGRWCVCVDPDEFLVYPYMRTRSLHALGDWLDASGRPSFHCLMLDAYSDRPLPRTRLASGQDPFEVCPYFDRDGYIQSPGWGSGVAIRGGPRMRTHFRDRPFQAPALNKIPFVKWRWNTHYRSSTHDAWPFELNRAERRRQGRRVPATTGALFHFKLVASLREKAVEEMRRGQHFDGSAEYEAYLRDRSGEFHVPGLSVRYEGPEQLAELGLISAGRWV